MVPVPVPADMAAARRGSQVLLRQGGDAEFCAGGEDTRGPGPDRGRCTRIDHRLSISGVWSHVEIRQRIHWVLCCAEGVPNEFIDGK